MFTRFLLACCLLASPAAAEILVQDGDYYPQLGGFESVRIAGGRIDKLVGIGGGSTLTIEGGSIGEVISGGNLDVTFRTGNFQLDTPLGFDTGPMADSDVMFLRFEDVYSFARTQPSPNEHAFAAWFSDFSYHEITITSDPVFRQPVIDYSNFIPLFPGDTDRNGIVDLDDLNTVRNNFGTSGAGDSAGDIDADGDVDLDDLNGVRNNFGIDYLPGENPVPESPTLGLLVVGTTAMILGRWWQCRPSRV